SPTIVLFFTSFPPSARVRVPVAGSVYASDGSGIADECRSRCRDTTRIPKRNATRTKPLARRPTGSWMIRSGVGSVTGGIACDQAATTPARRARAPPLRHHDPRELSPDREGVSPTKRRSTRPHRPRRSPTLPGLSARRAEAGGRDRRRRDRRASVLLPARVEAAGHE